MFSKIKSKDKATKLKERLNKKEIIVMPGCFEFEFSFGKIN